LTHNIAQLQIEVPHVLLIRPLNCHINLENSQSKPGVSMLDVTREFSHMSSLQGSNKLGIIPSPRPDTCGLKVGTCKPLAHVARAKKCVLHGKNVWPKRIWATHQQNIMDPTSFNLRNKYSKLNLGSQLSYDHTEFHNPAQPKA
jgi:hypothetical protein